MADPIELVIFDCDGVLVDSEVLGNQVLIDHLATLGITMSLDDAVARFRGCKMADLVTEVEQRFSCNLPDSFVANFRSKMAATFQSELKAIDGIASALEAIKLPICVASSGPRAKIDLSLSLTGLMAHFEGRIFSAYEVNSWKPDPGLFLHAARVMKTAPRHCIVIEDSVLGVQAAVSAGMRVVGYAPDTQHAKSLIALGAIPLEDAARLPQLLNTMIEI